ncbi:MAG TPA: isochorismate synthase [Acidimicrobiales bacterium]|nr:isochorismate synthase [Acidimicrobiales bacterium]
MRFLRQQIPRQSLETLRIVGARDGWLIETADVIRVGLGHTVDHVTLNEGLEIPSDVLSTLRHHELAGDDGPPGSGVVAFGALPFDRSTPSKLDVPEYCITQLKDGDAWVTCANGAHSWLEVLRTSVPPVQETQSLRSLSLEPTPDEYAHNVALAVEILRSKEIDKVVLARSVRGTVPEAIDAAAVAQRLHHREPLCAIYSIPTSDGRRFVGATPELIARRTGATLQSHPLAGTIALPPNVEPEDYLTWLLGSTKNLHEHNVPVNEIVGALEGVYDDVQADAGPSIVALRTLAHLGTWIEASCRNESDAPDALEVLRLLHPTSAVGGVPRQSAYELIRRLEQIDRGYYAGPLGWVDAHGDGEWWIGFRGVLVKGAEFEAWAGAGIVSESDPTAEREETKAKLASFLSSVLVDVVQ